MTKNLLVAIAGALAISVPAHASDINALVPQVNVLTVQQGNTVVAGNVALGDVNVETTAVGNIISINPEVNTQPDTAQVGAIAIQANVLSAQQANTQVTGVLAGGDVNISTDAFGSSASINSEDHVGVVGVQLNAISLQSANTSVSGVVSGGSINVDTVTVGNALNVNADTNGGGFGDALTGSLQINALSAQVSNTSVIGVGVGGELNVGTTAIGNSFSATGSNVTTVPVQANLGSAQIANTAVVGNVSAGAINVGSTAVGNSVTVSTGR